MAFLTKTVTSGSCKMPHLLEAASSRRPFSSSAGGPQTPGRLRPRTWLGAGLGAWECEGLCALGVYSGAALYYVGASSCQFAPKPCGGNCVCPCPFRHMCLNVPTWSDDHKAVGLSHVLSPSTSVGASLPLVRGCLGAEVAKANVAPRLTGSAKPLGRTTEMSLVARLRLDAGPCAGVSKGGPCLVLSVA